MTLMSRITDPGPEPKASALANSNAAQSVTALKWLVVAALLVFGGYRLSRRLNEHFAPEYGPFSLAASKIRVEGDRQYLWAKGPRDSQDVEADWFDLFSRYPQTEVLLEDAAPSIREDALGEDE